MKRTAHPTKTRKNSTNEFSGVITTSETKDFWYGNIESAMTMWMMNQKGTIQGYGSNEIYGENKDYFPNNCRYGRQRRCAEWRDGKPVQYTTHARSDPYSSRRQNRRNHT